MIRVTFFLITLELIKLLDFLFFFLKFFINCLNPNLQLKQSNTKVYR